ncbi:hypothetical protein HPB47_022181 [Ixodes persulcatus]|uniref:Uncharacterized protein n=1 Tax=Ixodes persulcatus TaxID=34615 RepID=A0AC60QAU4_IXOPE|nr:hypothetical protein HPB47_022181 [Ixodes persulcatus]
MAHTTLKVWVGKCRSYNKKTVLQQYVRSQERKPDVGMPQKVVIKDPKLPGYRTYARPIGNNQRGVCVFVHTTPDLVFINVEETEWENTGQDLGSDHCVVEVTIPLMGTMKAPRKYCYTNWDAFRRLEPTGQITDHDEWVRSTRRPAEEASRKIETTEDKDGKMDSRLAYLIEAKQFILVQWRKQHLNRRLRKKVAELNKAIQDHSKALAAQQWEDTCDAADGQMHNGAKWHVLRHLLDETKNKNFQRNRLAGIIQTAVRDLFVL